MSDEVKARRRYDNRGRRAAAVRTRSVILDAARELISLHGYLACTMRMIAERAGVAVDTVYATVGTKPQLFELLIETALSGRDEVVPGEERDYVSQMRATPDAHAKLAIYASAVTAIQQRMAPLFVALRSAAESEPELAALWRRISERRAENMRMLTENLVGTGQLRPGLAPHEVADIIWVMNSAEYYSLLVHDRGWAPARFEHWLRDTWTRTLLEDPVPAN